MGRHKKPGRPKGSVNKPKVFISSKVPPELSFVVGFEDKEAFLEARGVLGSTVVAFARFLRWVKGKYK